MELKNDTILKAIRKKFIRPLNDGCKYNINKLKVEQKTKHRETINLLEQASNTLENVNYLLKNYHLVDSNTLLRSSFENIMMAMMIQFDESIYNEFINLDIDADDRDKTRVWKIIDKFRTHLNDICKDFYEDINRKEKLEMLTELYDKLCNFTHSTLIVSTMIEIKNKHEKEVLQMIMYFNYYFLKLLLFQCLKYFTNDKSHYLYLDNIFYSYLLYLCQICNKIQAHNINFSKYNDYLYYDKNPIFFKNNEDDATKIKNGILELDDIVQSNLDDFNKGLNEFLK